MQPNQNPQITTTTIETRTMSGSREAVLTSLAVVGFLALVAFGIYLAVYSSRYVPGAVSKLDSAAVSLASIFNPAASSTLAVVPGSTASTTISFGDGATTTAATTTAATAPAKTTTVAPTAGQESSGSYQISGGTAPANYSGLPDLAVSITQVGYLTTNTTDSFVAASVVPAGYRPAIKFTVKNIGTNVAGPWRFSAVIPTQVGYIYDSNPQQALNPGDSIDYTLGFDQANVGPNEPISVKLNYDNAISESNTANDSANIMVTVQ